MKKIYASMLSLLGMGILTANAVNVTFKVNMINAPQSNNGVHIAGGFDANGTTGIPAWDPGAIPMSDADGDGIYEVTLDLMPGTYNYKFINGNAWGSDENQIPGTCNVGGNREVVITAAATVGPFCFNQCGDCAAPTAGKKVIRFGVNAVNQTPAPSTVTVAGNFNGWNNTANALTDANSDLIYEASIEVDDTITDLQFKYVIDGNWESPGGSCVNGGGNRFMSLTGTSNASVNLTCFNSCDPCVLGGPYDITFQIDMGASCATDADSITIGGPNGNWGSGYKMTPISGQTNKYTVTISVPAGSVTYKARFHKNGSTNYEDGPDRTHLAVADADLGMRCFGEITFGNCAPLPAASDVTFRVNVEDENLSPNGVFVMGSFTIPAWQGGAIAMTPTAADPFVYEVTVQDICPANLFYKFVIGVSGDAEYKEETHDFSTDGCGVDNGTFPDNRDFMRTAADAVLQYVFDSCEELTVGINENVKTKTFNVYPNPTADVANINFGKNVNNIEIVVTDLTGKTIVRESAFSGNVYQIRKNELNNGIYMISVRNQDGSISVEKLIIQ